MANDSDYIKTNSLKNGWATGTSETAPVSNRDIRKSEANFISHTGNRPLLEKFKAFIASIKKPIKESEIVLAFRCEQARGTRDDFRDAHMRLSEKRDQLKQDGRDLLVNLKNGSSLSLENIQLFERLNRKPSWVNLYNTVQTRADKAFCVSTNLDREIKVLEKEGKRQTRQLTRAERKLERASKNLLKAQNSPVEKSMLPRYKSHNGTHIQKEESKGLSPNLATLKEKRFANTYANEQLKLNRNNLFLSKNYSTYLKEQKTNLEYKRATSEKLTEYEKVLVQNYGPRPNLLNAYNLLSTKAGILDKAIGNIKKELEGRSLMEADYKDRIERYSGYGKEKLDHLNDRSNLDNPLKKYRYKNKLLPHEVKKLIEYRTEQIDSASSTTGTEKKRAEINVKRTDQLLERTTTKNEKTKEENQEKEIGINR